MNKTHFPLLSDFRAAILSTGLLATLTLSLPVRGADVFKADNADALNLTSSWIGATLPGASDRTVFDQTVTADQTTPLGADAAWAGILLPGATNTWTIEGSNQLSLGASGLTVVAASGNLVLAAPLRVALASAQTWSVASNRAVAVAATVAGPASAALTKAGEGTLTLTGDNSAFSGTNILGNGNANSSGSGVATPGSAGTVVLGHSRALGNGILSARGLQLWAGVPGLVLTNTVVFDTGALRFGGSNDLTLTGPVSLPGDRGLGNYSRTQTLRLNGPLALGTRKLTLQAVSGAATNGTIELNGPITGSGTLFVDTIYDNGIVVVSADNSGFTGTTSINAGALRVTHTNALGRTGSITLANSNARLELANGLNYPRAITVSDTGNAKGLRPAATATNVEFSGAIAVAETTSGNFELSADAGQTLTVSGAITGSGAGVEKLGEGTLVLPNANTFTDTFLLGNGTANQSGTGAATSGSGGFVLVSNNTSLGLGLLSAKGAQLQAAADGLVIPNPISLDSGALRFSGTHDLQLSGLITNSVSTRAIGNYSGKRTLTLSGTLATFPGYDINFQANDGAVSNGTVVVAGAVTGGGNLIIDTTFDYGLVIFAGNNSYTGRTGVSSGTLRLDYTSQNNSKLSDTAAFSLANATLELVGGSHLERVSATTFSGTAAITRKSGSAVLALGSLSGSGNLHLSAEDIASTIRENTNGVLPGVTVTAGGTTRWAANSGVSDGNGGFLIRAYAGIPSDVPRLGGILPDDASQNVRVVNGGTEGNVALSAASNTVNTLTVDASDGPATLALAAGILNVGGDAGGGVILAATSGALSVGSTPDDGILTTGGADNGLAAALVLANDNPSQPLTVNAAIKNNGTDAVSLTKIGTGTVVLTATNTYSGSTVIREGTLQVGNSGTGGQLGSGAIQNNGQLLFNRGTGSADLIVTPTLSGPGSVTQNSASGARVILRGAANSFYGGTVINSGTLRAEDTASDDALLQLGTGQVTLNGATLEARSNGSGDAGVIVTGDGVKGNDVVVNANSTLDVNRYNGTTRIRNTILFNRLTLGASQLTVSGANEYRSAFSGNISLTGNATFNTTQTDPDAWFSLDGAIQDGGLCFGFTKLGLGTLVLNGNNTFSGATYLGTGTGNTVDPASQTATASSGGFVVLGHNNALGSGTAYSLGSQFRARVPGLVIPNPVVVSNGGFRFGGTQSLTFSGAFTPVGASRTLGNYSADKTLTLGDIHLSGQSVTFEATAGALSNGTTLVRGVISNDQSTGAPTVKSSYTNGVVIFAGANTYTNATTIEVGASLQLGAGGTTGSLHPASKITNSGTLAFSRADTVRQGADFYGLLNGTGGVSQEGPGTVVFTATNTYTGATRIRPGATLQLGDGSTAGALSPTSQIAADGILAFNRSDTLTQGTHFSATFGGAGGVSQNGNGTVVLTGTNTYAGPTTVRAGTLFVNGDQSAATGTVTVLVGATLGGTGTLGGAIVAATNSILAPGVSGAGTLKAAALTLQNDAIYRWDVSPTTNDIIEVSGDLTLPTSFTLNVKRLAPGSIRNKVLFRYGGTYSGPAQASITTTGDASSKARTVLDSANKQVLVELTQTGTLIKFK